MSGIVRYGSYIPYCRLDRKAAGIGRGERAIASYDEDAVSMAVEAGRQALADCAVDTLVFATTSAPYAEKLNAAAIAAALDLPEQVTSLELAASSRMGLAALLLAADLVKAGRTSLVCASDVVVGGPGGARERNSGDAAVAFVTGKGNEIALLRGRASVTTEVLDVWRLPEDAFARQWEERFAIQALAPLAVETAQRALADAGVTAAQLSAVILDANNPRMAAAVPKALDLQPTQLADMLAASVGRSGVAHAGLVLASVLDSAQPGDKILVLSAADGCDALVLEVTEHIAQGRPQRSVARWLESKCNDIPYNSYLKWRGILPFEPPRRPDPQRPAAPVMKRHEQWKYGLYGCRCQQCGQVHLPPQRVCVKCRSVDKMTVERFAEQSCKVTTFTLDHLAYSLQPPVVSTVVDFDGGGRLACELTDADPAAVNIGDRLEMTFRRLYTSQGVHNYFWKARPVR